MQPLTEAEKKELMRVIGDGLPLPDHWQTRLFPTASTQPETGKEYRLVYDGKLKREQVLAHT